MHSKRFPTVNVEWKETKLKYKEKMEDQGEENWKQNPNINRLFCWGKKGKANVGTNA